MCTVGYSSTFVMVTLQKIWLATTARAKLHGTVKMDSALTILPSCESQTNISLSLQNQQINLFLNKKKSVSLIFSHPD